MSIKQKFLFVSCVCLYLAVTQTAAQTRITLNGKPKISSVAPSERSLTSTKYTKAEENRYLSYITGAYNKLLRDSVESARLLLLEATDLLPNHPANAEAFFQLGLISEKFEQYDDAAEYYRKATRINENLFKAHERRGMVNILRNEYEAALRDFSSFLTLKPGNADAHFYRGYALQHLDRNEEAVAEYFKAAEADPRKTEAHTAIALIMSKQGKQEEAIALMDKQILLHPNESTLYSTRGSLLMEVERTQLALYDFDQAIKFAPKDKACYINRAMAYKRMGEDSLAETDFNKARALGADNNLIENARKTAQLKGKVKK